MRDDRTGQIIVVFVSVRTGADEDGYAAATAAMERLAARQPGYRGIESTRGADGLGITLSYWADEESARAWRDQPDHAAIREAGRERWYSRYEVVVGDIARFYAWPRS